MFQWMNTSFEELPKVPDFFMKSKLTLSMCSLLLQVSGVILVCHACIVVTQNPAMLRTFALLCGQQ